jgi:hypothetical protein
MATRARDFNRAHQFSTPKDVAVATRLEELITRAEALAAQQRSGRIAVRASTSRRKELRKALRDEPLRHLVKIAAAASKELPELVKKFQLPAHNGSHQSFLTAARSIMADAESNRDLFLHHGMADTLLDDLTKSLAAYDSAVNQAHDGKSAHVGARADLKSVMDEIMLVVEQLDGMNLYRFRTDPELFAAWKSARDVAWPNGKVAATVAPTPPVVTPPAASRATGEGLKPAA